MEQQENSTVNFPQTKRILIYSDKCFPISETFIFRQVDALAKQNELVVVCHEFSNPHKHQLGDVAIHELPKYNGALEKIASYFLKIMGARDYSLGFRAARKLFDIIRSNEFNAVHVHYGWNALNFLRIAKQFNLPLVVSFHGNDACPSPERPEYGRRLPELFEYAKTIVLCTEDMIKRLPLNEHLHKVKIIPYGIDVDLFNNQLAGRRKNPAKLVLLHSGRIVSKKGVPDLIRVFHNLANVCPDIELQIVGDGPEFQNCLSLTKELDLTSKVFFHGRLPQHRVIEVMKDADIFVLNSRTDEAGNMEGLPNALLEAMSMQIAVVSTYHAGISNAVSNGLNGILVPEKDNDSLFKALKMLIDDPALRSELAKSARRTVEMNFNKCSTDRELRTIFQ